MKYLIYRSFNDMKKDEIIPRALDIAAENNISGELHKIYTAYMLINDENLFSLRCEKGDMPDGSLAAIAEEDIMNILADFFVVRNNFLAFAVLGLQKRLQSVNAAFSKVFLDFGDGDSQLAHV